MKRFRKLLIAAIMVLLPVQAAFADVAFSPFSGMGPGPMIIAFVIVAAFIVYLVIITRK